MHLPIRLLSIAASVFALTSCLMASTGPGMHRMMRMYDPSTETTFKGTVEGVAHPARGPLMGTHLSVKTGDGVVAVALGPANFIASSGFAFVKGNQLEITGSKVTINGKEWIIAREVVKDARTLTLRDKDGNPKWSRSMMGRRAPGQQ